MSNTQSLTILTTASSGSVSLTQIGLGSASISQSTKTASISVSLTITGTWVPANGNDPAPNNAVFEEHEQATLSGSSNDANGNTVSIPGTITDDINSHPNTRGTVNDMKYIPTTNAQFTINGSMSGSLSVSTGTNNLTLIPAASR